MVLKVSLVYYMLLFFYTLLIWGQNLLRMHQVRKQPRYYVTETWDSSDST